MVTNYLNVNICNIPVETDTARIVFPEHVNNNETCNYWTEVAFEILSIWLLWAIESIRNIWRSKLLKKTMFYEDISISYGLLSHILNLPDISAI